jgi:hypothetical protein
MRMQGDDFVVFVCPIVGIAQVARMARPAGFSQVARMTQTGLEPVDESHQPETSF